MIVKCCSSKSGISNSSEVVLKKKKNAMLYTQYKEYKKLFGILKDKEDPKVNEVPHLAEIQLEKLDITTGKLKRQNTILKTLETLFDREKKRYHKIKRFFDAEMLNQTPLEKQVKDITKKYLKTIFKKRLDEEQMVVYTKKENIEDDPEFYRLGLSKGERKVLIEMLLKSERVDALLKDKLEFDEKKLLIEDSDMEELGDEFR